MIKTLLLLLPRLDPYLLAIEDITSTIRPSETFGWKYGQDSFMQTDMPIIIS